MSTEIKSRSAVENRRQARNPARERPRRAPRAWRPRPCRLRERAHRRAVADSCPRRRAEDRRRRASCRHHVPAGDPAGAEARRGRAGGGRDLGCRPRAQCWACQGVRCRHEGGGAGSAPAEQHGRRGRHPGPERRGARSGRAGVAQRRCAADVPVHASRITLSGTVITTLPVSRRHCGRSGAGAGSRDGQSLAESLRRWHNGAARHEGAP